MWLCLLPGTVSSPVRIRVENWTFLLSRWVVFWLPPLNSSRPPLALWLEPFLPLHPMLFAFERLFIDVLRSVAELGSSSFLFSVEIRVVKMTFYASHRQLRQTHISISIMNETDWSRKVLSVAGPFDCPLIYEPVRLRSVWCVGGQKPSARRRIQIQIFDSDEKTFTNHLMTFSRHPRVTWGFISAVRFHLTFLISISNVVVHRSRVDLGQSRVNILLLFNISILNLLYCRGHSGWIESLQCLIQID